MNLRLVIWRSVLLLCLLPIFGCSSSVGDKIRVVEIPLFEIPPSSDSDDADWPVQILKFTDNRPNNTIAQIDQRDIAAQGDVGLVVQRAMEGSLRARGAQLSVLDGPILTGEVLRWRARITKQFPVSKAEAIAELRIRVSDRHGGAGFISSYNGKTVIEEPLLKEEKVKEILAEAMTHALEEALRDRKLIYVLTGNLS